MKTKDAFRNSSHYKRSIPDLTLIPYTYEQLLTKLMATATHMKIKVFWDIVFVIRQIVRCLYGVQCLHVQGQTVLLDCMTLKRQKCQMSGTIYPATQCNNPEE
jgi:hypothetical protein